MKKVTIVNYGMGNIGSIRAALEFLGAETELADSPAGIASAGRLVLPGVGSFRVAMENLKRLNLVEPVRQAAAQGKPLLGICLGMQLLAERGEEGGASEGLGLIPGEVRRLQPLDSSLKIPHVGFNTTRFHGDHPLIRHLGDQSDFYFVHSYRFLPASPETVSATAVYGQEFTAAVGKENVFGAQFHPEKSQVNGLRLLRNYLQSW